MGSDQVSNWPEINFLFSSLVELENVGCSQQNEKARQQLIQGLMEYLPFGHHPVLYIENIGNPGERARLRENYSDLLNEIKMRYDLRHWMSDGADLKRGAFLVSRLGGDLSTYEQFSDRINQLGARLESRLSIDGAETNEIAEQIKSFLFYEEEFSGNSENYYDPANSYINTVLDTKKGIPVSLSVLTILVSQAIGLPVYGVNLPGHFIVLYKGEKNSVYLDPFNRGNLLSREDCCKFLVRQGIEPSDHYLDKTCSMTIVKRMYRNLINFHASSGNLYQEKMLRYHMAILEGSSVNS